MLIWTAKFSRKKAVITVIAFGILMALLILLTGQLSEPEEVPTQPKLTTNEERVAYLGALGWEVKPEPLETLQFLLPETLGEPHLSYNTLQMAQGFDLSPFCGKQVSRYTYAVTNYPGRSAGVQANLYICEEAPVAGDICCPGSDGFQTTLVYPKAAEKE